MLTSSIAFIVLGEIGEVLVRGLESLFDLVMSTSKPGIGSPIE